MNQLENFTHRKVVVLRETDTAVMAAKTMKARHVGCVVVAGRDGSVAGLVTDRDLVDAVLATELGPNTRLKDIMTKDVHTVGDGATVTEALDVMKRHGVRRIPVVKITKASQRKCVGLVTLDDLIAAQKVSAEDLAQVIKSQVINRHAVWRGEVAQKDLFMKDLKAQFYQSAEEVEAFAAFVFESLFRRLHYSSAVQLMLQLPLELQMKLIPLKPGPDHGVTAESLRQGVRDVLRIPADAVMPALEKLFAVLRKHADSNEIDAVLLNLPEDIQSLLMFSAFPMRLTVGEPGHAS